MTAYRVVRRKFADLSGEGARRYGGRSNPPGVAAIYTAENVALAVLEVLVHLDYVEVPIDYVVMAIRFAATRAYCAKSNEFQEVVRHGASTFSESQFFKPVLRVPSAIVPREHNYVLYPAANGFEAVVDWIEPLEFDRRFFAFTQG